MHLCDRSKHNVPMSAGVLALGMDNGQARMCGSNRAPKGLASALRVSLGREGEGRQKINSLAAYPF